MFVVDSVNAEPTPNPSGCPRQFPCRRRWSSTSPTSSSVSSDTQPRTRLLPGGRIEGDGLTMQQIMQLAWDITVDELVASTPKWWNETKYSIIAKTSTAVSGAGQDTNVDVDDLKAMLRQLITERFQLKSHYEERPVTAYALMADKPKMAKADPSNRTGFKEGPAPGQKDQRNQILGRMVTVRNMSMPQFAEDLQRIAGGYIRVPVEDQTGLEGAYDFTLTFTPIGLLNGWPRRRRRRRSAAGGGDASDPSGGLSLFDAVKAAGSEARDAQAPDEGAGDRRNPREADRLGWRTSDQPRSHGVIVRPMRMPSGLMRRVTVCPQGSCRLSTRSV